MIFAGFPGIIADRMGGYIPVYALFAVLTLITFVCVMMAYHDVKVQKLRRRRAREKARERARAREQKQEQ